MGGEGHALAFLNALEGGIRGHESRYAHGITRRALSSKAPNEATRAHPRILAPASLCTPYPFHKLRSYAYKATAIATGIATMPTKPTASSLL